MLRSSCRVWSCSGPLISSHRYFTILSSSELSIHVQPQVILSENIQLSWMLHLNSIQMTTVNQLLFITTILCDLLEVLFRNQVYIYCLELNHMKRFVLSIKHLWQEDQPCKIIFHTIKGNIQCLFTIIPISRNIICSCCFTIYDTIFTNKKTRGHRHTINIRP